MTNNNSNDPKIQITQDLKNIPENGIILYPITRSEVERKDISRLLRDLEPGEATSKSDVRNLFGSIIFSFTVGEHRPEIYELPEIREFVALVNEIWPCWLFYSVPVSDAITPLISCSLKQISAFRQSGSAEVEVIYSIDEMTKLVLGWIPTAVGIADWAGIPRRRIHQRLHHWLAMLLPPEIARDYATTMGDPE